jgi:formyl transferase-like protein
MRIAVIANSIAGGLRIAAETESLSGVDVFIVVCNVRMRPTLVRWARELVLLGKSFGRWTPARLWRYTRSRKLIVFSRALDDPSSTDRLRSLQCDVGLHAANVIYREPVISAFRLGILNAHIGILPAYRGRSVAEWSVLHGDRTGVTVFFIDSGIDTGTRIVLREFISPDGKNSVAELKKMLFGYDARLYRKALKALMSAEFKFEENCISKGQRYYVMSKLFTTAVNQILRAQSCGRKPVDGPLSRPTELVSPGAERDLLRS